MTEMSMQAGPETPQETETAPGTGDVVISCTGLGKCYETYASPQKRLLDLFRPGSPRRSKSFWGLRGLDLSVCRGETLGIIGRNGAGKSTLLQLLCGTLTSSEGQLVVKGRIAALLELGAGFNPEFTGIENVYLNAAILGLSRAQIDARLDSILAFAEIGDFVHEPVKHYSSGMFLRLAFAVVAHVDADVLIIDEALAVGDAVFAQKCMRFLHEFRQRGVLLLVSHDLPSITALCDRALWLENGQVRMLGQAKNVVEAYLEAIYADQQSVGGHTAANDETAARHKRVSGQEAEAPHDLRRDLLLHSNLRNDVEIRPFDPDSRGFGTGKVRIEWVGFRDDANRPLAWLVGGEELTLEVRFQVREQVSDLIVGFLFKDRLGQALFGDNTYLTYRDQPPMFRSGECGVARFKFSMPYLPSGDYAITIGVAGGTQQQHVQHCWMHEALVISCVASHVTHGLLGMPMKDIRVEALKDGETEVRLND